MVLKGKCSMPMLPGCGVSPQVFHYCPLPGGGKGVVDPDCLLYVTRKAVELEALDLKVLVIGNGGREHAICWKLAGSKLVSKVYCYPGNGGTAGIAENVKLEADSNEAVAEFAAQQGIELTVVGPENYLARGIVDLFRSRWLKIYGPGQDAARLESSKAFAKNFMKKYRIPTAWFETFTDAAAAKEFIRKAGAPIVVKADGLAAGKGVVVALDLETALGAVDEMMTRRVFGEAGAAVVVEEYLEGEEVSLLAFCDGVAAAPMIPVQDHKRIGDGDTGPNTGGMGTYAPTTVFTREIAERVKREILDPTMKAMREEGCPFVGTLFLGLIMTAQGPKVIEYNVRFGDPETQVVLPLLDADLGEILSGAAEGKLDPALVRWKEGLTAVCVVAASGGYPGQYETGKVIRGFEGVKDSFVFHAGTKLSGSGEILTAGGRVLNVVHLGRDIREASEGAYRDLREIKFEGMYYRKDIGKREMVRFER
jgi:phosphoribosylamine---glycine ligase